MSARTWSSGMVWGIGSHSSGNTSRSGALPWASNCRNSQLRSGSSSSSSTLSSYRFSSPVRNKEKREEKEEEEKEEWPNKRASIEFVESIPELKIGGSGELSVVERLSALLQTGQFSDIHIQVGQGEQMQTFKAHRVLLATASQPLCELVHSTKNRRSNGPEATIVHVSDLEPTTVKTVLKYIYTDIVDVTSVSQAIETVKACIRWSLKRMLKKTIDFLNKFLDEFEPANDQMKNDLCDLLMFCQSNLIELVEKCWQVLLKYCNEVVPCLEFLNMDAATVLKMMENDEFNYKNQLGLFEAVRDWGLNQLLKNNLDMEQLSFIVEELLKNVDFEAIKDTDFVDTVLPSDCLGRADIISFFMTRGLDIPRDFGVNNNKQVLSLSENESVSTHCKVRRFRRGYKLPHDNIYQHHELRFRADKAIKLFGVGFGFLFSNTDMGVTVHCQGPWERVQWTDITQSYCRVTWEKLKTADIRLMFQDPVRLEGNHCYKILVKVGRMSAGSSEVELWGGCKALPNAESNDVKFYFLKSAVDPQKEVNEDECDVTSGMITELLFEIDTDEPDPIKPPLQRQESEAVETVPRVRRRERPMETTINRRNYSTSSEQTITETVYIKRRRPHLESESSLSTTSTSAPSFMRPRASLSSASEFRNKSWETTIPSHRTSISERYRPSYSPSTVRTRSDESKDATSFYLRPQPSLTSPSVSDVRKPRESMIRTPPSRDSEISYQSPRSTSYVRESPSFMARSRDVSSYRFSRDGIGSRFGQQLLSSRPSYGSSSSSLGSSSSYTSSVGRFSLRK